jgi:hypothetical protein
MPVLDNPNVVQEATTPDVTVQRPVFGGISDVTKDAFILELRHYLQTSYTKVPDGELPRIGKYAVSGDVSTDPLETAVALVRSHPDITENLPVIAVMSTSGKNKKLGFSDSTTGFTIKPATVTGTEEGPFALTDGDTLIFTTQPDGVETNIVTSTMVFRDFMFDDISQATLQEIINVINFQALYASAFAARTGAGTMLSLKAGGPQGRVFPNKITITGGTARTIFGFTLNQEDQNYGAGKVAYSRHHMAADFSVMVEVLAESDNIRTELSDLVYSFFAYVLNERKFQFYGRSVYSDDILDEHYQIIVKDNEMSISGDQEIPRSGDQKDKIYVCRMTIPVTTIMYSDRIITNLDGSMAKPVINIEMLDGSELPDPN